MTTKKTKSAAVKRWKPNLTESLRQRFDAFKEYEAEPDTRTMEKLLIVAEAQRKRK